MWLCPVCKKENIENASACLYCLKGKYCSDCLLPYVGDVCTNCGKSHSEGLWLTEKEYEKCMASVAEIASDLNDDEVSTSVVEPEGVSKSDENDALIADEEVAPETQNNDIEKSDDVEIQDAGEVPLVESEPAPVEVESLVEEQSCEREANQNDSQSEIEADNSFADVTESDIDDVVQKELDKEENKRNALWIILISLLCVIAIFAATMFYIKPWKDASPKQSAKPVVKNPDKSVEVIEDSSESDSAEFLAESSEQSDVFADSEIFVESDLDVEDEVVETEPVEDTKTSSETVMAPVENENANNGEESIVVSTDSAKKISSRFSAGYNHILAISEYANIYSVGDSSKSSNQQSKLDISSYTGAVAVSARGSHSVALLDDGRVVASGSNKDDRCNVGEWTSIVDVKAGSYHTLGLKSDGTVVAVGKNNYGQCNVEGWTNIVEISAGAEHNVALKNDGTVVAVGNNGFGQCNVEGWTDIVQISAGDRYTVGLKSDGTVVSCGENNYGQCKVGAWKDIVHVSAGMTHTLGLKSDGTVVAVGRNRSGEGNVKDWKNVVCVFAGGEHFSVALCADGKVLVTGLNKNSLYEAANWTQIAM